MHSKSVKKVEALEEAIRKRATMWQKKYPGVIQGVHVGKKEVGDSATPYYSVVFHVRKKLDLPPDYQLPEVLRISIPGEGRITVPTDVVEAGEGELGSVAPGKKVTQVISSTYGSSGPFVTRGDDVFLLSNMHVLGASYLDQGTASASVPKAKELPNIVVLRGSRRALVASFSKGRVNQFIDAAIARVINPADVDFALPGVHGTEGGPPRGLRKLSTRDAHRGTRVHMAGARSGLRTGTVKTKNAMKVFQYPIGKLNLHTLLQVSPAISQRGDSGSAVYDDERRILGILVGRDQKFSYVFPIETILRTFRVNLIT